MFIVSSALKVHLRLYSFQILHTFSPLICVFFVWKNAFWVQEWVNS